MAWRQVSSVRVRHVEYSDEVLRDKRRENRLLNENLDRLARLEGIAMRRLSDTRKRIAGERLPLQTQTSQSSLARSRPVSIDSYPPAIGAIGATAAVRGGGSGVHGATGTLLESAARSRRISLQPQPHAATSATRFPSSSGTASGVNSGSSSKHSSESSDSR